MSDKPESNFIARNKPVAFFLVVVPIMLGWGYYAGREQANGEISTLKLDTITASGKIVKARVDVAPQSLIQASDLEECSAFANRITGVEASLSEIIGKKARYGLNKKQVVMRLDLE